MKRLIFFLFACTAAFSQTLPMSAGVVGQNLIQRQYLGFNAANSAKTVTLSVSPTNAPLIVVVGCSGNFATSSWTASVTDTAKNSYAQLGATSGTYPQANSTTQVCIGFAALNQTRAQAPNQTAVQPVTGITFTISGSSSSNTTVSIMAYAVSNVIPSLAAIDHVAGAAFSSATAISVNNGPTSSQPNELVIAAGCASTGTISLASNSALTFDSGSQAIGSGSNIASCFGASAILGPPTGVSGSFTDGSSASGSEVVILLRGYTLTDGGLPHVSGTTWNNGSLGTGTTGNNWGTSPILVSLPGQWVKASNPGSGSTASTLMPAVPGKIHIITSFGFSLMGDGTGAASHQAVTIADSGAGTIFTSNCSEPAGIAALGCQFNSGPVNIPGMPGQSLTLAFGGNTADALEAVWMNGYDVDVPGVIY